MRPEKLSKLSPMDPGGDVGPPHEACEDVRGQTDREEGGEGEEEEEGFLVVKGGDGGFSSASSSSNSSMPSSSSLPPSSSLSPPVGMEDDEMLTGCSRTFPGLRLFRRKAIAKSGLHQLPCQPSTSFLSRTDPEANIRSTVDWTESAVYGDHIWFETNVSGDYCYVGEQHCIARALQKSVSRKKCAACKIVAHTICIEQLEKINFRCKPSFRESGSRNIREPIVVRHHWVHRRRQEGKCKQCGKGFQQKFAFHSKEIVAISCSWCKQAYHNKVSCFMLQQIEESCPVGAHAALIVPPTWIIRIRRHQSSMKSSKKKKRTSFKRKSSKKGAEEGRQWKPFIIRPIPSPLVKPLLVFVNPKSGGNQGTKILQSFMWYLNPRQVFDLSQGGPKDGLELYRKVHNLRILACGGDGTVEAKKRVTSHRQSVSATGGDRGKPEPTPLDSRIASILGTASGVESCQRRKETPIWQSPQRRPSWKRWLTRRFRPQRVLSAWMNPGCSRYIPRPWHTQKWSGPDRQSPTITKGHHRCHK